jgi:hypothetical protein
MQAEAGEITLHVLGGDLERLSYSPVPHGLAMILLLKEDPIVGAGDFLLFDPPLVSLQ